MEKITITIKTVNSAFEDSKEDELARILEEISSVIRNGNNPTVVRDINGNKVGTIEYE